MKKITLLLIGLGLYFNNAFGQTAKVSIAVNNIKATVLNGGDIFTDLNSARFEVPRSIDIGSRQTHTIYAAGLWIGGFDSMQNLHLAASTYRQSGKAFQPGPVSDSEYSNKNAIYDKIYYITKNEIQIFKDGGAMTPAILSWPGNGNTLKGEAKRLAPFLDINKNDIYEPQLREYPLIPGHACTFTIFNDNYKKNESLKIEVHQFVYSFVSQDIMNNTILVAYKIFNRSGSNYSAMRMGAWVDYDIGNYIDDAYCSDSTRNLMIAFNGDDDDEGITGYGLNPPAMGCLFLDQKLERNIKYENDFGGHGNPSTPLQYYNYMKGFYRDNTPIPKYKCFSQGSDLPADIRSLGSTPAFSLPANASVCFTMAHIFARNNFGGAQGSVNLLKLSSDSVQKYYTQNLIGKVCAAYPGGTGISSILIKVSKIKVYPNPGRDVIEVDVCDSEVESIQACEIINTLGETVFMSIVKDGKASIPISQLSPGVYFIRAGNEIVKFVKE